MYDRKRHGGKIVMGAIAEGAVASALLALLAHVVPTGSMPMYKVAAAGFAVAFVASIIVQSLMSRRGRGSHRRRYTRRPR